VSAASETELGTCRHLRAFCANGTHIRINSLALSRLSPPYGTRTGPFHPVRTCSGRHPRIYLFAGGCLRSDLPILPNSSAGLLPSVGGIEPPLYHPVVLFTGICNFRPTCRCIRALGLFDGRGSSSLPAGAL
jgi:hypothetical protein